MDRVTLLNEALEKRDELIWIDVRSPIEFDHAHIPGAISVPLFSNEERAHVGTLYKQEGPLIAMQVGLGYLMDRLPQIQRSMIEAYQSQSSASQIATSRIAQPCTEEKRHLMFYCARGGMRSEYMTRLAHALGLPVSRVSGGYKQFRSWVLESIAKERKLVRLGGLTGTGKTQLLQSAQLQGGRILDLEELARHRGSVLGGLNRVETWGSEMFENRLALRLDELDRDRADEPIWLEDESRMIGPCKIPDSLYNQMCNSPLYVIELDDEKRVDRLLEDYADATDQQLLDSMERVSKRLGSERCERIREAIAQGDRRANYIAWLDYYDRLYSRHLEKQSYQTLSEQELLSLIFGSL